MIFSENQTRLAINLISHADEVTLQSLLIKVKMPRLKLLLKTIERSIRNRDPLSDCLCAFCHMHAVNKEDGYEICDSCLAE